MERRDFLRYAGFGLFAAAAFAVYEMSPDSRKVSPIDSNGNPLEPLHRLDLIEASNTEDFIINFDNIVSQMKQSFGLIPVDHVPYENVQALQFMVGYRPGKFDFDSYSFYIGTKGEKKYRGLIANTLPQKNPSESTSIKIYLLDSQVQKSTVGVFDSKEFTMNSDLWSRLTATMVEDYNEYAKDPSRADKLARELVKRNR